MPHIRFALSRGYTVSGLRLRGATQGGARGLTCPWLQICHPAGVQFAASPTIQNFSAHSKHVLPANFNNTYQIEL